MMLRIHVFGLHGIQSRVVTEFDDAEIKGNLYLDFRPSYSACSCHRWKDSWDCFHCRCGSSCGRAARWRIEEAE